MTSAHDIRRAKTDDLDAMLAFQRAAIARIPEGHYPAAARDIWLHTPVPGLRRLVEDGRYFVAERNGVPIAGAGWDPGMPTPEAAALRGIFVHPDWMASGLGTRLTRIVEAEALAAGHPRLFVPAALNAAGFYARLGYRGDGLGAFDVNGVSLLYRKMWKQAAWIVADRRRA